MSLELLLGLILHFISIYIAFRIFIIFMGLAA